MKSFATLHRALWNYDHNCGIAKIHFEPLGIVAFAFDKAGQPMEDVNIACNQETQYHRTQYKKAGYLLREGVQIDRDVEEIRVQIVDGGFVFPEINLAIKFEEGCRYFRSQNNNEWQIMESPFIEYQPCKSLICKSYA